VDRPEATLVNVGLLEQTALDGVFVTRFQPLFLMHSAVNRTTVSAENIKDI
jgi:hypothetical protein